MPTFVTQTDLAAFIGKTRETVSDYVAKGIIKKRKDGKYDLQKCVEQIIAWQSDKLAGRVGNEQLQTQRVRLASAQADREERRTLELTGSLVSLDAVAKILDREFRNVRERFLSIPGTCSDRLAPLTSKDRIEVFEILNEVVYEALSDVADGKTIAKEAAGGKIVWTRDDIARGREPVDG
jgi:phage terminase Nu1 subunit (DNA packaging protein)